MAVFRNRYVKLVLKLSITAGAVYLVLRQIDVAQAQALLAKANWGWILLAAGLFNLSKVVSAFRLHALFVATGLRLGHAYNLKLYYVGMFYNLFLPGSIGGDGYKVYLLNRQYGTRVKDLIAASLLDRISGVAALGFLSGILLLFSSYEPPVRSGDWLIGVGTLLLIPAYYGLCRWLFRKFIPAFWYTNLLSQGVQLLQVVCAVCLLYALSVPGSYVDYTALFLISSVVSVLPFTIGGVGARELVFLLGYQYLDIDKTAAVSFTFLFFAITAVASLVGIPFTWQIEGGRETAKST